MALCLIAVTGEGLRSISASCKASANSAVADLNNRITPSVNPTAKVSNSSVYLQQSTSLFVSLEVVLNVVTRTLL